MINRQKRIQRPLPFTIATNNMKYCGAALTKQVKNQNDKNVKSLKKKLKKISENGNISHAIV